MQIEYFKLIDRIIGLDLAARTIQVEANVPVESTIFEGHFPGHPLMPGVLLLETMAQASGWLIIGITRFTCMPFFAAVKDAKFRSFVTPGMALVVEAALEHEGSGYGITNCKVTKEDGTAVADAQITLRIMPFPSPEFSDAMRARARNVGFTIPA